MRTSFGPIRRRSSTSGGLGFDSRDTEAPFPDWSIAPASTQRRLFNTRLDSKTVRAIDFFEDGTIDESALAALVAQAVKLNASK
jgi:hypothetical protein